MIRLVFLLEEYSMRVLLEGLLPRVFPDLNYICISHEGKQDLERSIPRKLRAWKEPGARFVIIRDNDGGDCQALKRKLFSVCKKNHKNDTLIRIACQELEAWYLGEPKALADAFNKPKLIDLSKKEKFREPDSICRPSEELTKLITGFQKVSCARLMSKRLSADGNCSHSYQAFLNGVRKIINS